MADEAENNLTPEETGDIIPTDNERRFLANLRVQAKRNPHALLAVLIQIHDGEVHHGTLCLGAAPNCSTIRL